MQPFFEQTDIVSPHHSYVNTLYVYPRWISLGKLKGEQFLCYTKWCNAVTLQTQEVATCRFA